MKVIVPMFISTTDDTTMFVFEGAVEGKASEYYIINKDDDSGTSSSYTKTNLLT